MSIKRQSDENEDEPKLIIDEDWKTQVQREMEALKQSKQEPERPEDTVSSPAEAASPATPVSPQDSPMHKPGVAPPASFDYLVSGMATQALAAMGQIPDDEGNPFPANLEYARHYIDLLGVLESKTKGNLTQHEQRFLQDALHQLRMLFVTVNKG